MNRSAPAAASAHHGRLAIAFHWLSFLPATLAYLAIKMRGPRGNTSRELWMNTHVWAGLLQLVIHAGSAQRGSAPHREDLPRACRQYFLRRNWPACCIGVMASLHTPCPYAVTAR